MATCNIASAAFECAMRGLYASSAWLGDVATERGEAVSSASVFDLDAVSVQGFALFNTRQFALAAHVTKSATSPKARFLNVYASLLSIDSDAAQKTRDAELRALFATLDTQVLTDPFLLFAKGLVASKLNMREKAQSLFISAVSGFPLLWAAWEELASQIVTYDQLKHVQNQLPSLATSATNPCYLYFLFQTSKHLLTLQEASHALATLQSITNPNSTSIRLAEASMYYHHQNHPHSVALFTEIYTEHPSLLDKADEFANALYVLEFGPQLSHLAQRCVRVDEYRPETCVAVANYYSFKNDHEKAVAYLKRAVVLDAGNSLPWTLIGHEFLEMKNQAAAIEVYRKAVDINPRDFRAWYALGNIYQMLKMPLYALYYFQKATSLKQYDPRFWTGLGGCFEEVGQMNEAVRCLRRAVECDGAGNTELVRLARVYEKLGKGVCGGSTKGAMDAAAGCWKQVFDGDLLGRNGGKKGGKNIDVLDETDHFEALEAAEFLVRHAIARNDYRGLESCLEYIEEKGGENEKALARECKALMTAI